MERKNNARRRRRPAIYAVGSIGTSWSKVRKDGERERRPASPRPQAPAGWDEIDRWRLCFFREGRNWRTNGSSCLPCLALLNINCMHACPSIHGFGFGLWVSWQTSHACCSLQAAHAIAMAMDGFYRYWYSFFIYYVLVGGTNFL
jgi:hypothetical protein